MKLSKQSWKLVNSYINYGMVEIPRQESPKSTTSEQTIIGNDEAAPNS